MKYDIRITELHRQLILTALLQCKLQGYFNADQNTREEIDLLHDMFDHLMTDAAENPGALHDFTA